MIVFVTATLSPTSLKTLVQQNLGKAAYDFATFLAALKKRSLVQAEKQAKWTQRPSVLTAAGGRIKAHCGACIRAFETRYLTLGQMAEGAKTAPIHMARKLDRAEITAVKETACFVRVYPCRLAFLPPVSRR